jgi:hypothetical protein
VFVFSDFYIVPPGTAQVFFWSNNALPIGSGVVVYPSLDIVRISMAIN